MVYVIFLQGNPLIVLGDAIDSFLTTSDPTTDGLCLLSKSDVEKTRIWASNSGSSSQMKANPEQRKWFHAASGARWTWTILLICACCIVVCSFLLMSLAAIGNRSVASLGFGKLSTQTLIQGDRFAPAQIPNTSGKIVASIIVANLPQLVLSFLYLHVNGLLTSMFVAREWSGFATARKPLRVSNPRRMQRSTHFLQLPYRVSVPLLVVFGLLHWLVSQSIFLAVVSEWAATGELVNAAQVATCGFSPLPIILVIVVGLLILVSIILLGTKKYNAGIPLAGSCSVAISAACHKDNCESDMPLQWGVIPNTKHCAFSNGPVEMVDLGQVYA